MRWRTFFETAASLFRAEPRTKSVDGLQEKYDDCMVLVRLAYENKSYSRRSLARRMSQPRWTAAYRLLVSVDVLDKRGEVWRAMAPDFETAEWRVREELNRRRAREASRSYVPRR